MVSLHLVGEARLYWCRCFYYVLKGLYCEKFDEDAYEFFRKDMEAAHNTGQDIIPIVINSYGGQVYSVLGMMEIIKNI